MADLSTIFSWFETGNFPTEAQFRETFSSFWHRSESFPMSNIEGLAEQFQSTLSSEQFQNHLESEDAHTEFLAKKDGSNLSVEQIGQWRKKLGILLSNAYVDGAEGEGNVYTKAQVGSLIEAIQIINEEQWTAIEHIESLLSSDDINLDELQELVDKIKENAQLIENLQQGVVEDMNVNINSDFSGYGEGLQNQKILNETMVSDIMTFLSGLDEKIDYVEKSAAGGICPLNENGKVSEDYLPNLSATAVHNFLKTKKVADEVVTVDSMITGSEVTMILSQVIDEDLDWSVYFNGVFVPKSLTSMEANNSIKINLAPLNIEPVIGDYFVTKYYKL